MKYFVFLLITLLLFSCSDPTSVDADRDKIVIDDPSKAPAKYEVIPNKIDIGELLINSQKELAFKIKNLTTEKLTLWNINLKSNPTFAEFNYTNPIVLQPKGDSQDNLDISLIFKANNYGYFSDTLIFDNFKNPITEIKAVIPALYAEDIEFADTRVSEFQLEIFNFKNISNKKVSITEFELIDSNNVFLNEPKVILPITINPNSESTDIKLTFNPKSIINYTAEIRIKATFEGAEYPYRQIVKVSGNGTK